MGEQLPTSSTPEEPDIDEWTGASRDTETDAAVDGSAEEAAMMDVEESLETPDPAAPTDVPKAGDDHFLDEFGRGES